MALMTDYNIDYLNECEQNCLGTVILPYGLRTLNTNVPTRVKENSKTLIDYIITDLHNSENFTNIISDTPLRTLKIKPIDHFATTTKTDHKIKKRTKVTIKEILTGAILTGANSDWSNSYNPNCAEGMFTAFVNIIESALRKSVPKRTVFI